MVLMDMQMPVMDGFTATRILRQELGLSLPIIAMTAGVLESERERSREAGITDFIPKPIEVDEMLAVLRRHLPQQQPPPPTTARRRPPHRPRTPMPAEADLLAAMAAAASAGAGAPWPLAPTRGGPARRRPSWSARRCRPARPPSSIWMA
jgi:DNA-binding response OmpR family regulator